MAQRPKQKIFIERALGTAGPGQRGTPGRWYAGRDVDAEGVERRREWHEVDLDRLASEEGVEVQWLVDRDAPSISTAEAEEYLNAGKRGQ